MKQVLKNIIELITEVTVRYKNEILAKYDDALQNLKGVMEQTMNTIKASNEYNIEKVIESLLTVIKSGNDSVNATYTRN